MAQPRGNRAATNGLTRQESSQSLRHERQDSVTAPAALRIDVSLSIERESEKAKDENPTDAVETPKPDETESPKKEDAGEADKKENTAIKVEEGDDAIFLSRAFKPYMAEEVAKWDTPFHPCEYKPLLSPSLPSIFPRPGPAIQTALLFKDPHQVITVPVYLSPAPTDHLKPMFTPPHPLPIPKTFFIAVPEDGLLRHDLHMALLDLSKSLQALSFSEADFRETINRGYYRNPLGVCAVLELIGRAYIPHAVDRLRGIQLTLNEHHESTEAAWELLGYRWEHGIQLNILNRIGHDVSDIYRLGHTAVGNFNAVEERFLVFRDSFEEAVFQSVLCKIDVGRVWVKGVMDDAMSSVVETRRLLQRLELRQRVWAHPYYIG